MAQINDTRNVSALLSMLKANVLPDVMLDFVIKAGVVVIKEFLRVDLLSKG